MSTPSTVIQQFHDARADYDMSKDSRFQRKRQGLPYGGGSADYHYRTENHYYNDIEKARDMSRNDAVIGQTIDRAVSNIIQDGFTLCPLTKDKRLNKDLMSRWSEETEDCETFDLSGEYCFKDYEHHSMRSILRDGDCVNIGTASGHLQHLEAHTIQTSRGKKNTVLGVTKDSSNRRNTYWYQADPAKSSRNEKEKAVPLKVRNSNGVRQLFHVYNSRRMSQTRGVTALAPIFDVAGMFEDINFAKMVQQQTVSCFAIFRSRESEFNPAGTHQGYGEQSTETSTTGEIRYIDGIAPGMEIIGAPGEQLHGFSPSVPNAEFFHHVRLLLQLIGINFGLPLSSVLLDPSDTNFSGWRGAMDEARRGFRLNQRNLAERFHRPFYKWKLTKWMEKDAALRNAAKTKDIFAHNWQFPAWSYIEPAKDAQGDLIRISNGLASPRQVMAERSRKWEDVADETVEDISYAIKAAKAAAKKLNRLDDGERVSWRDLYTPPMSNGVQMSLDHTKEGDVDGKDA